jgi:hypothetical protein
MNTRAAMIIFSHLSDVQEVPTHNSNHARINFVKFLINKYPNTETEIDPDAEWQEFQSKHPNLSKLQS